MKLKIKIILYIVISTSVIFILSVGYINYRYWNFTRDLALKTADLYAKQNANTAQNILNKDFKVIQILKNIFEGYDKIPPETREKIYQDALINVSANNPNFLSVWLSWELEAIDKNWKLPYGHVTVATYWENGNLEIIQDSLNIEGDQPGSPYFLLKSNVTNTLVSEPYFFSYTKDTGSTFLETTIATSIYNNEKFVGVVGVDVSLTRFQIMLNELRPFENSKLLIVSNDGTIIAHNNEKYQGKQFEKIYPEFNHLKIIKKIKQGEHFWFNFTNKDKEEDYVSFYPIKIEGSTTDWSLGFIVPTSFITENIRRNSRILAIFSGISLIIISLIIWIILSLIVSPIENATKTLDRLSKGNTQGNLKIKYSSRDELGKMSKAVNILVDSLRRTQVFAEEIGKGNLKAEYSLSGEYDILGQSLIDMRDNLVKAQRIEQERNEETEKISWMQTGITEINEILREKSQDITTLTSELIKFLIHYTKSIQGGFYLIEERDEKEYIEMKAAYAFDRKKEMKARLEIGEGLIGRVIKEKQSLNISNLPEGYLFIRSGLGDKSPQNLIIIPLIFEDSVLGAFELAGFKKYKKSDLEFLEQIAVRITSSISVLLKNIETRNLLKESRLQTTTFEIKEKQFMKQQMRLKKQKNTLKQQSDFLNIALDALKTLGVYFELDEQKYIVDINDYLLNKFEIKKEDIINKNIADVIRIQPNAILWMSKFWEDVLSGEIRKKQTLYEWNDKSFETMDTCFVIEREQTRRIIIIGTKQ